MTTKLAQTPKEKLANATRAQQKCEWTLKAASEALRRFDEQHPNLDVKLRQERARLEAAQTEAESALRDAKDACCFCHHEHYAMAQNWGRSSGKWLRRDKGHEDRG